MFSLAILSFFCLVLSRVLTNSYQFRLAKLLKNSPDSKDAFIQMLGENNYNYFLAMADLYEVYRVKFTFFDFFFRPPSNRSNAIAFYSASLVFLAWWTITSTIVLNSVLALLIIFVTYEYVSYWKDTFFRTVNNSSFQVSLIELYDYYKPTNRMG